MMPLKSNCFCRLTLAGLLNATSGWFLAVGVDETVILQTPPLHPY